MFKKFFRSIRNGTVKLLVDFICYLMPDLRVLKEITSLKIANETKDRLYDAREHLIGQKVEEAFNSLKEPENLNHNDHNLSTIDNNSTNQEDQNEIKTKKIKKKHKTQKPISGLEEPTNEQLQYWKLRQAYKADKKEIATQTDETETDSREVQTDNIFSEKSPIEIEALLDQLGAQILSNKIVYEKSIQDLAQELQNFQSAANNQCIKLENLLTEILDNQELLQNQDFIANLRYQWLCED